jgi:sugar phosphate isomerase/epimerase
MNKDELLNHFGFKVMDRRKEEVEPLLLQAANETRPFEIGLYYHDPATHDLLDSLLPGSGIPLCTHLDHRRLNVFALDDDDVYESLRRQIETSLLWGARYGVTHLSAFCLSKRPEHQPALIEKLMRLLRALNRVCREYRFPIHIENTYHELDLYRALFQGIVRERLNFLHFCFDFGHAKVWSARPLRDWIGFLSEIHQAGRSLHFHLHTNRGLSDEHLSFMQGEWLEICAMDDYTAPWNSYQALSVLDNSFPTAFKIMEVPPQEGRENLQRVIEEISRIRRQEALISA